MKRILFAAVIILTSGIAFCEDSKENSDELVKQAVENDKVLSRDIEIATNKMDKELEKYLEAKNRYDNAMIELKSNMIKAYEESMKRYTKKGDIRMATALMAVVDKMKENENVVENVVVSENIKIVSAKYGINDKWTDATDYVKNLIKTENPKFDTTSFKEALGDPARRIDKVLEITYKISNKTEIRTFNHGDRIILEK